MSEYAFIVSFITLLALLLTGAVGGHVAAIGDMIASAIQHVS
ncbi:MAG: hypothetical protein NW215_03545 [Hyphomicrobiales bacterium]|nr:hypothetical protein [Hyphomicrobiales bacterium]